ncbi:MAG TPA: peroxiredoxin-like family protein [Polyangiaceae bacterium]|nr:peroxiredoxin-like family protein [Polyangiaceae bacterium]
MSENPIADSMVLDSGGTAVPIARLWQGAPAVIGFVRHFGCLLCHEQVSVLRQAQMEIEGRGAKLWIIGNGRAGDARTFALRSGLQDSVFTDPSRALYRALGMKHGVARTFAFESLKNAYRAFQDGHRQSMTKGDPWQQGGTIVVGRGGDLAYVYVSQVAGDHAPLGEVLAAIPR